MILLLGVHPSQPVLPPHLMQSKPIEQKFMTKLHTFYLPC